MKQSWKYHRDSRASVSKWVLGNSWVTKYDKEEYCRIGLRGNVVRGWGIKSPRRARLAATELLGLAP